jgi:hypothetical protein
MSVSLYVMFGILPDSIRILSRRYADFGFADFANSSNHIANLLFLFLTSGKWYRPIYKEGCA